MAARVEIAGAGFAGLAAAAALAQRGWDVRVHEQGEQLREFGAGLLMWRNAMLALELIGVADTVRAEGMLPRSYDTSYNGELVSSEIPGYPYWAVSRPRLYGMFLDAARAAGAEVVPGSRAVAADPAGVLELASGERIEADLVIGADGAGSAVRNSIPDFVQQRRRYSDGVSRTLVRRPEEFRGAEWDRVIDYWTFEPNVMRILFIPCGPEELYLAFMSETANEAASRMPLDVEVWSERFPHLRSAIELASVAELTRRDEYQTNHVSTWSSGRVAIVGDSANAMCPALGQGASTGVVNAVELGVTLAEIASNTSSASIEDGLRLWEARQRPITDKVQSISAFMAETRTLSKGSGFTGENMDAANYVAPGVPPEILAKYPIPAGLT